MAQDGLLHRAGLDLALLHMDRIAFTMKNHDNTLFSRLYSHKYDVGLTLWAAFSFVNPHCLTYNPHLHLFPAADSACSSLEVVQIVPLFV